MQVSVDKQQRGLVDITVELSIDEYQPFLEKAAQAMSQSTSIPGFRPGKASYDVLKQRVGEQAIWEQALEHAVQKTLPQALEQEKLVTVGSPKIDIVKLAAGNPVTYKANIALLPSVELPDYSKLSVKKSEVAVDDKKVDEQLEQLRTMRATEAAVDRAAQKGDKVEIDFDTYIDKIPIDQGAQKKFPLVLGEGNFIPGFEDNVVGVKKGEEKSFDLTFPKEYHQKKLAGKKAQFKVKVNEVFERTLPELDDDFAKSLGGYGSLGEVKEAIKESIEQEEQHKAQHQLEEAVIDKLIEKAKFDDLPDILISTETKKMIQELQHNLAGRGIDFNDYLKHINKSQQDLLLEFTPQAIKRVKGALIMRAVAQQNDIKPTDEEINTELEQLKKTYGGNPEFDKQIKSPDYKGYIANVITSRKTMQHLVDTMTK